MSHVRAVIAERGLHPADAVVLLPYAQLMQEARHAWADGAARAQFLPRFETSVNWLRSLGGFCATGDDIRLDAAHDLLTAAALLQRAGLGAQSGALAARLMQAAWSLAGVAAAVPPAKRLAWGQRMATAMAPELEAPVLAMEAAVARIALAWAASSAYAADALFRAEPALLVLVQGFATDPVTQALQQRLNTRALALPLARSAVAGLRSLHAATDGEDEAQQAAACVLAHLAQGRSPVGLVAQDRVLTRRVRALLAQQGVVLRDETGWTLSTTRAAAHVMLLLRAAVWDASTDAVLDWLKAAPAFAAESVSAAEAELRRAGVRQWRSVPADQALALQVRPLLEKLRSTRPLQQWLHDLRSALRASGQWAGLARDDAGIAVLDALRLHEGLEAEFAAVPGRMALTDLTAWVNQTLESATFRPRHPAQAQVVILPLSQLLGRPLAAVVLPGCDERRLPVSPEPADLWTPAQRVLLGLPTREQLAQAQRAAWDYCQQTPWLDILWRRSEGGEVLLPSGFVQQRMLEPDSTLADDPRVSRAVALQPCVPPLPSGAALPVTRLSASAYEDLRRCPYRFFALRQLKLQEADELDTELDKRDVGNWLHAVLRHFHLALQQAPTTDPLHRIALMDAAAQQCRMELGLSEPEFLPHAAAWPRLRAGYLEWLQGHEAGGNQFEAAERWCEMPMGGVTLVGKLDRVDRQSDGSALVLDYKTEGRSVTTQRIKLGSEDTQLPFYAALLADDTLAGAYVNVAEREGTRAYAQADIVELRDLLLEGIHQDLQALQAGAALPALGAGAVCDYCAARGLCRKDFWAEGALPHPAGGHV